jgi:hypothetical protein
MNTQKFLLTIGLLIIIGLVGYMILSYSSGLMPEEAEEPIDEPTTEETTEIDISSWQQYQAPTDSPVSFSFNHPPKVIISQIEPTIYEIKFIGPDSEPRTEITDGYYLSIQLIDNQTLSEYVSEQTPLGTVEETSIKSYEARRYTTESMLGNEVEHLTIHLVPTANYLVDITQSIYGEDSDTYQAEVDAIIQSLEFSSPASKGGDAIIQIQSPAANESVESPIQLSGQARGMWFFEASAPVVVTNWDGLIIGESYITAEGDWMTEDFVPFTGTVSYSLPADTVSATGTVIFQKANPSGLPQHDDAYEVVVTLVPNTTGE